MKIFFKGLGFFIFSDFEEVGMVVDFVDFYVLDVVFFFCLDGFGEKSVVKLVKVIEVS